MVVQEGVTMSSKKFDLGVLLYSTDYSYKGSEHFLDVGISHAERLKAVSGKSMAMTIDGDDYSKKVGVEHIPLNIPMTKYLKHIFFLVKSFLKLSSIARKNKDKEMVLVGRNLIAGAIVSIVSRMFGGSSVVYYEYDWVNWKEGMIDRGAAKMIEKIPLKWSDFIIATTSSLKKILVSRGKQSSKVFVIPNHVNTKIFRPLRKDRARKELGMNSNEKSLFFAGRLEEQKNVSTMIKAVSRIPKIKFYIAGRGSLGEKLRELVRERGIEDRVYFLDKIPQDKLVKYVNACDVFLFPTLYEGHSMALIEVMTCRTPIISSRVEGNIDVIEDGVNGLLVNPLDVEELKEKIEKLLNDRKLANRLARKAKEDSRKYSLKEVMKKERRVFKPIFDSI